jgi:hypothetical protein
VHIKVIKEGRKQMPEKPSQMTATVLPASLAVIEVFTPDQLVDVGNSEYTVIIGARPGVVRDDGTVSQPGDVLSVQEDGTLQARPAGTAGNFERCSKTAAGLVFRPVGIDGRSFLIPCALDAPNK